MRVCRLSWPAARLGGCAASRSRSVPETLSSIYVHQSRALSDILIELLRGSNNYVANQIFLEIGAHRLGGPVSLEKSLTVANEALAAHGLADSIHLEEGSGISRGNSFTARNDLPGLIAGLAAARGNDMQHHLITAGGASLRQHWNAGEAMHCSPRSFLAMTSAFRPARSTSISPVSLSK